MFEDVQVCEKKYKKMPNQSQLANQSSVVDADPQLNVTVTEQSNVLCFLFNILLAHGVVEVGCLEVDRDLNRVCGRTLGPQEQKGAGLV